MRTKSSIKNSISAFFSNTISILIGLVAQAVFIKILGEEYLGINGLFSNIVSMLGIVELGLGSAIIYNLYKPIAEEDKETIKSLMKFYQKAYTWIALVIFVLGILLLPIMPFFIGKITIDININIVYILFIIDIICSYLNTYKRSILYADQKNYIVNIIHTLYLIILNMAQLAILFIYKNYYLYLIIKIIMRVIENMVITLYVNKKYAYLKEKNTKPLDKNLEKDILKKVKALFFHKLAGFLVSGTDNMIISKFLGVIQVGLYSNYYMIINALSILFGQMITALTPSIGNLLTAHDTEKNNKVFCQLRFINFLIACYSSIILLVVIQPFIKIWLGEKYILSMIVVITLVFNYFQKMMRNTYLAFKEAAGIYYEDRFVPIIESLLNILFSIILVKIIGLPGVFIGTIISGLILWCYSYPKYVYKNLLNRSYFNYAKETMAYILLFIAIAVLTLLITTKWEISSSMLQIIINMVVAILVPTSVMLPLFWKNDNFKYYKTLFLKMAKRNK